MNDASGAPAVTPVPYFEVVHDDGETLEVVNREDYDRLMMHTDLFRTTLRNIANEHWNSGRAVPLSLMEYAQAALNVEVDAGEHQQ